MILVLVETDLDGAAVEVVARGAHVRPQPVRRGRRRARRRRGRRRRSSDELRKELAAYGVRTVHHVVGDGLAAYSGAGWASAILSAREPRGRSW